MKLFNLIKNIDQFGYKFNLKIQKQEQYQTSIGGFVSILMIAVFAALFYYQVIETNSRQYIQMEAAVDSD